MKTWWKCLAPSLPPALRIECAAHGIYEQAMTGDSGEAAKHTKTTKHPTITTANADRGERWHARLRDLAAKGGAR